MRPCIRCGITVNGMLDGKHTAQSGKHAPQAVAHRLFADHYAESHDARAAAVHAGLPANDGWDLVCCQAVQELLEAKRRLIEHRKWCKEQLRQERIGEILAGVHCIFVGPPMDPDEAQYRLRAADLELKAYGAYIRRTQVQIGGNVGLGGNEPRRGLSPEMAQSIREDVLGIPKLKAVEDDTG